MIGLLISLLIVAGAAVFLILLARRRSASTAVGSGQEIVDAREALDRLQKGLLPAEFVERIYDRADLEYVMKNAPREVQREFMAERKRIAIAWIARVREEIRELWHFHLRESRHHEAMSVRSEFALAFDFLSLLAACRILQMFVRLRGPYAVPGFVHTTMAAAERVCDASEKSLAVLTPPMPLRAEASDARVAG
jgi:hypothetical protein